MKKTYWLAGFICLSVLFGAGAGVIGNIDGIIHKNVSVQTDVQGDPGRTVFIIDPGHGGEDGGCSAADGTLEKDLNLLLSKDVCDILNSMGYNSILTRNDDKLLYDIYGDLNDYTGKKKVYDLKNRLRLSEEVGAEALISIHMNKFPDGKYRGTQLYYSANREDSNVLAEEIQTTVSKNLQEDNNRQIKKAGSSIFILNRSRIPAVLCECGFLSNEDETALLNTPEYRQKLSFCIAAAAVNWLSGRAE